MKFAISIILIFILTIIIYSNTFSVPFQFDDLAHIIDNYKIHTLNIKEIFQYSKSRFLLHLSFGLNYYFNDGRVFGFHLVNLAIHILNSILVFLLALKTFNTIPSVMDARILSAFFASLIFAIHPIQTESVTYIYQRGESLAGLFYFLALFLYIKSRTNSRYPLRGIYYYGCLSSMFFCIFTKPIAVTLPVAILFYELYFISPTLKALKKNARFILPVLAFIILPFLLARFDILESKNVGIRFEPEYLSYYYTKLRVLVTALRLLILPINQNLEHYFPLSSSLFNPITTFFSLIFIAAIFFIIFYTFRRFPILSFGIIWFFLLLSVTTLLYLDDLFFEHYLYLPIFGYALMLPAVSFYFFKRMNLKKSCWIFTLALIILFYSISTYKRNEVWKTELSLWEDTVKKSPDKARPNYILAVYYFKKGRLEEAFAFYKKALRLNPRYAEAYYRLGEYYFSLGDIEKSIINYKKAIEINPEFFEAYLNLGSVYLYAKQYKDARMCFNNALKLTDVPEYRKKIEEINQFLLTPVY